MRRVFINTIKISAAAIFAILIARLMGLEHAISAGIVAILTIQPTKKETLRTALDRGLAFAIALLIAFVCFTWTDFQVEGFFLYLAIFIGVCQIFGWYSSMAMNSVIISHFLGFGAMTGEHLLNEILIFLIGIILGVLVNLHLTKDHDGIEALIQSMDEQIRTILRRMSEKLLTEDRSVSADYNGECFAILERNIHDAEMAAQTNLANQFGSGDTFDLDYISMRRRQQYILMEMYKNVRYMRGTPHTVQQISDFLRKVSEEYHQKNTVVDLMDGFYELDLSMKSQPLPATRPEFEDRAQLYVLLRKIEEFLEIKRLFMRK